MSGDKLLCVYASYLRFIWLLRLASIQTLTLKIVHSKLWFNLKQRASVSSVRNTKTLNYVIGKLSKKFEVDVYFTCFN